MSDRRPSTTLTVLRKELLLERRVPQVLPAMGFFGVTTLVVFHFALGRRSVEGDLAAGVLVTTLLFVAMLAINRAFVADREEGGFDAFLLAPVDRTALFLAKAATLLAFLALVEVVLVPAFVVLLLGPGLGAGQLGTLVLLLALADLGIAVVGTLVAALAVQTRARDLIGPLVALPLLVPLVIGLARAVAPVLTAGGAAGIDGRYVAILGLYDVVFGLLAYALFEYLLDD